MLLICYYKYNNLWGDKMPDGMLKDVLEAEKKNRETEENARLEAQKIIADAKAQAEDFVKSNRIAFDEFEKTELDKKRLEGERYIAAEKLKAQKRAQQLKENAAEKLSEAVGFVREALIK